MTDAQARSVVAGVALILLAAIGAIAGGYAAVNTVLVIALLWLLWDRVALHDRVDKASDDADLAIGKAEAIENHLSGLEPPGAGRHATPPHLERSQA